jgi:phosphohistidine swiveling domain-containing protein
MDSLKPYIVPLSLAAETDEKIIGGKTAKLAQLAHAGFRIPDGFCITIFAYQKCMKTNDLDKKIKFELGRKPFESMRWEEIWDAALRIRSAFHAAEIPFDVEDQIIKAFKKLGIKKTLAVRSSAPKEDSAKASFAGLHESYVGVQGAQGLLEAVRLVWSSLWSDAALLYQHELGLDPLHSSMAVVVQELVEEKISGVAFGGDPRNPETDRSIIEAVPGLCRDLVDGVLDPDRWILKRSTGEVVEMKPGKREYKELPAPLLQTDDLKRIYSALQAIEALFGWLPDTEWTGKDDHFTLLQARPITTSGAQPEDDRAYYLTLRPGEQRLKALAKRVAEELIPRMEAEGKKLAVEDLSKLNDQQLAEAIKVRQQSLEKWKKIYWDDFIPFAHGVRHLATYYNDAVQPADSYEFVGLFKGQSMISTQRNQKLMALAKQIQVQPVLMKHLQKLITEPVEASTPWQVLAHQIETTPKGSDFLRAFQNLLDEYMDVSYGRERIKNQPVQVLKNIIEMAKAPTFPKISDQEQTNIARLEQKLFDAVGESRHAEAREILHIGRLSWRLRDDDNLLLGRIESQFFRALIQGADRLRAVGRLESDAKTDEKTAEIIADALRHPEGRNIQIPVEKPKAAPSSPKQSNVKPRQLIGQPAAPGLVSGKVRIIITPEDLGKFRAGEILVCDAIQPNMTHLVPLAGAIIERRGGMLIHGAIIAREMGIPCVNGVPDAAEILENGDLVTVDGHLGIVTVGEAEFDLELKFKKRGNLRIRN